MAPRTVIKDVDQLREFIKLELRKEDYFNKIWKKAAQKR